MILTAHFGAWGSVTSSSWWKTPFPIRIPPYTQHYLICNEFRLWSRFWRFRLICCFLCDWSTRASSIFDFKVSWAILDKFAHVCATFLLYTKEPSHDIFPEISLISKPIVLSTRLMNDRILSSTNLTIAWHNRIWITPYMIINIIY